MEMIRVILVIMLYEGGSVFSVHARRSLSKAELAEITQVAKEEMVDSFYDDYQDYYTNIEQATPRYTEPTLPPTTEPTPPPTPETQASLEARLRQIILNNGTPACNVSENSLWALCKPIVLQTCKDEYKNLCRWRPRLKYRMFVRQMYRHFSRPPDMSFLQPQPLNEWLDEEMEELRGETEDEKFSISTTENNFSLTFTNSDYENGERNIGRTREDLHPRQRNMFERMPGWMRVWTEERDDDYEDSGDDEPNGLPAWMSPPEDPIPDPIPGMHNPFYPPPIHQPTRRIHRTRKLRRHRRRAPRRHYDRQRDRPSNLHMSDRFRQTTTNRLFGNSHRRTMMNFGNEHSSRRMHRRPDQGHFRPHIPPQRMHFPREDDYEVPEEPQWMAGFPHHQPREPEEELICEEMEEDPEICVDIVDREEKCHDKLSTVCPKYVATRRLLEEQLENAYSSRGLTDDEITDDEDSPDYDSERYQRQRIMVQRRPIVIEAIRISRGGKGDASVMARMHGKSTVRFRIPASDFSDKRALGRAIGRQARERYNP